MSFNLFDFLFGSGAQEKQLQTLTPEQQQLFQMLQGALSGQDQSSPLGQSFQYLSNLAQGDPETLQQFTAPMQRQFQEQTIPDLAARFAGMGSGGAFKGSGFRQAALREGSNLAEKMQALTSGIQMQAAGQLPGYFGQATQPMFQPALTEPTMGLLPGAAVGFAQGAGKTFGGGI